jgi:hypothetical protein
LRLERGAKEHWSGPVQLRAAPMEPAGAPPEARLAQLERKLQKAEASRRRLKEGLVRSVFLIERAHHIMCRSRGGAAETGAESMSPGVQEQASV